MPELIEREHIATRELTLDETLAILGDRITRKLPALRPAASPRTAPVVFTGSYKRTRRMRAYRFKALSLDDSRAAAITERPTLPAVIDGPYMREGIATVKIDRLQLARQRRLRRALVILAAVTLLMFWLLT